MTTEYEIEIIGYEYICPKCGESDAMKLETVNEYVISCDCGYCRVLPGLDCPKCHENEMDNIEPMDDGSFHCHTCGKDYEVPD